MNLLHELPYGVVRFFVKRAGDNFVAPKFCGLGFDIRSCKVANS
jgi:hypothetical protein